MLELCFHLRVLFRFSISDCLDISITILDSLSENESQRMSTISDSFGYVEFHGYPPFFKTNSSFSLHIDAQDGLNIRY